MTDFPVTLVEFRALSGAIVLPWRTTIPISEESAVVRAGCCVRRRGAEAPESGAAPPWGAVGVDHGALPHKSGALWQGHGAPVRRRGKSPDPSPRLQASRPRLPRRAGTAEQPPLSPAGNVRRPGPPRRRLPRQANQASRPRLPRRAGNAEQPPLSPPGKVRRPGPPRRAASPASEPGFPSTPSPAGGDRRAAAVEPAGEGPASGASPAGGFPGKRPVRAFCTGGYV